MRWICVAKLGLIALTGIGIVSRVTAQTPVPETKPAPVDPRDDPSMWGFGSIGGLYDGSSKRAMPPAIVPTTWLVVPRASKADEEQVLTRFALETDAPLPTAAKRASDSSEVKDTSGSSGAEASSRASGASDDALSSSKGAATLEWLAVESREPQDALVAFTTITSETDDVRMAQLTGAEVLFVNGEGFAGDVERLGFRGVPVLLKQGANRVFVAGIRESFTLELWKPATRMVIGTWDAAWEGEDLACEATYPLFNASLEPAKYVHVHYGHARPEGSDCPLGLTDWRDGGYLVPLGAMMGASYWIDMVGSCTSAGNGRFELAPICVYADDDRDADRQIIRRPLRGETDPTSPSAPRDLALGKDRSARRTYEPRVLVYGTQGSPEDTAALLALARLDQQLAWCRTRSLPLLLPDNFYLKGKLSSENDWISWRVQDRRVVLYGNADTNSAWSSVVPAELGFDVRRTGLTRGTTKLEGTDLFGWFSCARSGESRSLANVVVFSTGASGTRAGSLLHPFLYGFDKVDDTLFRRDEHAPHGRILIPATGR